MKKFLFIVLIGLMTFALAACGSDDAQGDTDDEKETITIDHKLEDGVEVERIQKRSLFLISVCLTP